MDTNFTVPAPIVGASPAAPPTAAPSATTLSPSVAVDECKTHLCFEFISHVILQIIYIYIYIYSCKTHNISSKLGFVGLLTKSK